MSGTPRGTVELRTCRPAALVAVAGSTVASGRAATPPAGHTRTSVVAHQPQFVYERQCSCASASLSVLSPPRDGAGLGALVLGARSPGTRCGGPGRPGSSPAPVHRAHRNRRRRPRPAAHHRRGHRTRPPPVRRATPGPRLPRRPRPQPRHRRPRRRPRAGRRPIAWPSRTTSSSRSYASTPTAWLPSSPDSVQVYARMSTTSSCLPVVA
jgi:hypothetical protein